jgi:cobalt-zinc-cadmium efflux system outer membrane protein
LPGSNSQLSLQQAIALANHQNLDIIAAREGRAVAQAGIITASERPNPSFNFTVLRDTPHEGFWFTQPIELGGKRGHRIQVAQQQQGVTEVSIAAVELQIREATRQAYFNLSLAQAETLQLADAVRLAERLAKIARERYQAGDAAKLEVIQARLVVAQARASLEVAQQQEKVALSRLNTLLDEPPSKPWDLITPLSALPPTAALPDLVQQAYQASPQIRSFERQLRVERSRETLYKADRVPDLDLEYGVDFNSPGQGGFREGPRSQISLVLPLFNRYQGQIAQSLANQQVLEDQIAAGRRTVAGTVESSYLMLTSQETKVNLYQTKLVPASKQLERMAEESYSAGKTDILAVITAQQNEQGIQQQYLQSLYAAQAAFATLEGAVGAPLQ